MQFRWDYSIYSNFADGHNSISGSKSQVPEHCICQLLRLTSAWVEHVTERRHIHSFMKTVTFLAFNTQTCISQVCFHPAVLSNNNLFSESFKKMLDFTRYVIGWLSSFSQLD